MLNLLESENPKEKLPLGGDGSSEIARLVPEATKHFSWFIYSKLEFGRVTHQTQGNSWLRNSVLAQTY